MPISKYTPVENIRALMPEEWAQWSREHGSSIPAVADRFMSDLTQGGTRPPDLISQGREQFSGDPVGAITSALAAGPLAVSPSMVKEIERQQIGMPGMLVGPVYHGTTKAFSEFASPKYKRGMQAGFGTHFTSDPAFASKYAEGPGGNVHKVVVDVEKVLDADKIYNVTDPEFQIAKDLLKGTGRKPITSGGQFVIPIDVVSPQKAEKVLRTHGYDALKYNAKQITLSRPGSYIKGPEAPSITILNPNAVKPAWSVSSDQVIHGLDELGQ